jgi:hypothetical protein
MLPRLRWKAANATPACGPRIAHFSPSEIAAAFAILVERQAGAVLVGGSAQLAHRNDQIISFAARYALSTMFVYGLAARQGGLLSYGAVVSEFTRLAGVYTGRILKGEKPSDLPVQRSTRFEFIINLKTARALMYRMPASPRHKLKSGVHALASPHRRQKMPEGSTLV